MRRPSPIDSSPRQTAIGYKLESYNLFHEAPEGYAKVLYILSPHSISQHSSEHLKSTLTTLIGMFSLDTTRVIDLVLDAFELNLEYSDAYLSILEDIASSHIVQKLMIRKLKQAASHNMKKMLEIKRIAKFAKERNEKTLGAGRVIILEYTNIRDKTDRDFKRIVEASSYPHDEFSGVGTSPVLSKKVLDQVKEFANTEPMTQGASSLALFDVLALLVSSSIIPLEALWESLTPDVKELRQHQLKVQRYEIDYADRYGRKSLNKGGEKQIRKEQNQNIEAWEIHSLNFAFMASNQKIAFIRSLLRIRNLELAMDRINVLEKVKCKPKKSIFFVETVSNFGCYMLSPLVNHGENNVVDKLPNIYSLQLERSFQKSSCTSFEAVLSDVAPLVCKVGARFTFPYNYTFIGMLSEVLALMIPQSDTIDIYIEELLGRCLLPSLSMQQENPWISQSIWKALKQLPYYLRYKYIRQMENERIHNGLGDAFDKSQGHFRDKEGSQKSWQ